MNFPDFFSRAFSDERKPYEYQCRLAESEFESRLIDIPTGLGKTAAVILAWLWNRVHRKSDSWPRRLVYCLPMRTLVEQTRNETETWLKNLGLAESVGLYLLMGGEDADEWDIHPEKDAILIGTQDMLLSRALNRGYGMSRYRWPMHFGLLNNDCLWVMDETQLMGPGLGTACQLEAFRNSSAQGFGSFGAAGAVTWYMSATSNPDLLTTREWRGVSRPENFVFGLTDEEKAATSGPIHRRRTAVKRLELKPSASWIDSSETLVTDLLGKHQEMLTSIDGDTDLPARTLIICNTVDRAVAVHQQLAGRNLQGYDLLLLHSRFRPPERKKQMERLEWVDRSHFPNGQIVVATQVIEAGVDVSSGILCSEVAPLASLVQRLGRLNRAGEFNDSKWQPLAIIVGVGVEKEPPRENKEAREKREKENAKRCLPYEVAPCDAAFGSLKKLHGTASPADLESIQGEIAASIPRCPYSLQRHELIDFFDTDANLSLGFTDVSPFVRGLDEDTDIQVCWREPWPQEDGSEGTGRPNFNHDYQRNELCTIPISKASKVRDILNHGWIWRGDKAGWISIRDSGLSPGMTILLPLDAGGYDESVGWTGDDKNKPNASHYEPREWTSDEDQLSSQYHGWQSIAVHTAEVGEQLDHILGHLAPLLVDNVSRDALRAGILWHDIGKNHEAWQQAVVLALEEAGITGKDNHKPFGKFSLSDSPHLRHPDGSPRFSGKELYRELRKLSRDFRPRVDHEVASALAFRQSEQTRLGPARDTDLASLLTEYVIMSHHGRVRKVLRDEIPRLPESREDTETVRGITHGSSLPPVTINGQTFICDFLSTDCRKMGRDVAGHESYTRGVLRLLDHHGPFELAYLEALFRAADIRASILAAQTP